jgi:hypothetical protein
VLLGGHVAALDPLREPDLLQRGQQLHPPDRAQVQPQRVERRLDRQVDLGLLRSVLGRVRVVALRLGDERGRLAVGSDHVDPVLHEKAVELLDLLLRDLDLFER